ncbi:hypothetical protein GBA52_026378 [Prunus armeniaca]|nr:hypothetical protein GBA52_026378 [Prunus armeniaca]
MKSTSGDSTTINIPESRNKTVAKGETPYVRIQAAHPMHDQKGGWKKGISIFDFILRLGTTAAALGAAIAMGSSEQTLPFFTQFFVIGMGIVGAYLVLSLPFSIVTIVRPHAVAPRLLLLIFDTLALTLNTSCAASAAAIVYLSHNGNSDANWLAICQQFGDFCQQSSGAVVSAFVAVVIFVILILMSASALRKV